MNMDTNFCTQFFWKMFEVFGVVYRFFIVPCVIKPFDHSLLYWTSYLSDFHVTFHRVYFVLKVVTCSVHLIDQSSNISKNGSKNQHSNQAACNAIDKRHCLLWVSSVTNSGQGKSGPVETEHILLPEAGEVGISYIRVGPSITAKAQVPTQGKVQATIPVNNDDDD